MGADFCNSKKQMYWLDNFILLKELDTVDDIETCEMLDVIHTDNPIIKEVEEWQNRIFDADYSKVDILAMIAELDITESLKKFLELFGWGLGSSKNQRPATIELKERTPYQGRYYNLSSAYKSALKKENREDGEDQNAQVTSVGQQQRVVLSKFWCSEKDRQYLYCYHL